MENHIYEIILSVATLLTLIVTSVRSYYGEQQKLKREELERQWDREDRHARTTQTLQMIQENTDVSVKAFNEANSVNEKLLKIHEDVKAVVTPVKPSSE